MKRKGERIVRNQWMWPVLVVLVALPGVAGAIRVDGAKPRRVVEVARDSRLGVEVWTDRGEGGVYQAGDAIRIHFRASQDCYLLLYNVDTEGRVHLLYPGRRFEPHWVTGRREYVLPGPSAGYDLRVDGPAGVEYVQALASLEPFQRLPDYLDPDAGDPADEDGAELVRGDWRNRGRIVGDPFKGMDRINRSILPYDCDENDCYAGGYCSYYVQKKVSYPRYLCADCHGPAAWHAFDPYSSRCSVFDIRADYDWRWRPRRPFYGSAYWYYWRRSDCPPRYFTFRNRWSSDDGWVRFRDAFGDRVIWKKNPGDDRKDDDRNWRGKGSGDAPHDPSGKSGNGWGRGGRRVNRDPVQVPAREKDSGEDTPVRFRSRSRDLAPPPEEGRRREPEAVPVPAPPPKDEDRRRDPKPQPVPEEPKREEPRREDPRIAPKPRDEGRGDQRREPDRGGEERPKGRKGKDF